jgi:hypothetical protein
LHGEHSGDEWNEKSDEWLIFGDERLGIWMIGEIFLPFKSINPEKHLPGDQYESA